MSIARPSMRGMLGRATGAPVTPAPLTVSGLVEWFDFSHSSSKTLLAPRELQSIATDFAAGEATVACTNHGLVKYTAGGNPFEDSITLSGLTGDLVSLNGNHSITEVVNANSFKIASGLADGFYEFEANEAFVDTQTSKIQQIAGRGGNFTFAITANESAPFNASDHARFYRRDSTYTSPQFMDFTSWPATKSQPLTFIAVYKATGASSIFSSLCASNGTFNQNPNFHTYSTSNPTTTRAMRLYAGGTSRITSYAAVNNVWILVFLLNGTSTKMWRNGGSSLVNGLSPGTNGLVANPRVGDASGLNYALDGELYQWALYETSVSNSDLNLIGNYFKDNVTGASWTNIT